MLDELKKLARRIAARGIPCVLDPRDAHPPCAIVDLDRVGGDRTLCGVDGVQAVIWLVAPDYGREHALRVLGEMWEKITDIAPQATPADLIIPGSATLPALHTEPVILL